MKANFSNAGSSAAGFTKADVERWRHLRGSMTQTVRGSHVDITVRIYQWGRALWFVTLAAAGTGVAFMAYEIATGFLSGRVQDILEALKAGR